MREHKEIDGFSVTAISGTYVVMLGFNLEESATKDLLGFAIHRTDHVENENYWLRGFKTFKETEPDPCPGALYSTLEHPIQSFQWADYSAKNGYEYTYKIVPLKGKPKNIKLGESIKIKIKTEAEDSGKHAIYFNRGVAGSQAYCRKFDHKTPDEVSGRRAFVWLSRGLEEAIFKFIDRANSSEYGLRASVYEFNYYPVLEAFGRAADAGADVKIIYDSRRDNPKRSSDEAIEWAGIRKLMIRRTQPKSYISHNKFIILLKNGKPIELLTGSANYTKSGIFGQSNLCHIVRDEHVAEKYYEYWKQLSRDPKNSDLKKWTGAETPDPEGSCTPNTITPLFSPRKTLEALEWYAERMDEAEKSVCLTAAFGVNSRLANILAKDKPYLRYVLLERRGNNFDVFTQDPDVLTSIGSHLKEPVYGWTREVLTNYSLHVKYIHTKFMLIDPLSDTPIVITGSANFSDASTKNNDENMLVIHGNTRVADVYLGEFFRLFHHFYYRYVMNKQKAAVGSEDKKRSYLKPDNSWTKKYYVSGSIKEKQRLFFSQKLA